MQLLAGGTIGEAVTAPHGHKLDRVLTARNTLLCLAAGCLSAGQGYDQVLRTVFAMPGLGPVAPGTPVPAGPALSEARMRSGERVARRAFEVDAARSDAELGTGQLRHGLEVTAFDGATAALAPPPPRAETHLGQDGSRTTLPAHRRSDLHHHHHAVKSPAMAAFSKQSSLS